MPKRYIEQIIDDKLDSFLIRVKDDLSNQMDYKIHRAVEVRRSEVNELVNEKVSESSKSLKNYFKHFLYQEIDKAVDTRKKEVKNQFIIWTAAVSSAFLAITAAIMYFINASGFTVDDIIVMLRDKIVSPNFLAERINDDSEDSDSIRIAMSNSVWRTLKSDDIEQMNDIFSNSKFDDQLIVTNKGQILQLLSDPAPVNMEETIETIKILGSQYSRVITGEYKNLDNKLTNCGIKFDQNEKRVILSFPPKKQNRLIEPMYWIKCPSNNHPNIFISLSIDGVVVDNIWVVGVERRTDNNIDGIRARITNAVAKEFESKEMHATGGHVLNANMKIYNVND